MKTKIIIIGLLMANLNVGGQVDYSLAKVGKRIDGVYIFFRAEPANEYDYIATVEVGNWSWNTPDVSFEKIIRKAKQKYPYFHAIIFRTEDLKKADIIKFRGLEISGGGFRIGDKVSYKNNWENKIYYGEIIALNNTEQNATFKYIDIYGKWQTKEVEYVKLNPLSESQYISFTNEQKKEIEKNNFKIGDNVSFVIAYGAFNDKFKQYNGNIIELDEINHKATIKYIDEFKKPQITNIAYQKLIREK